MRNISLEVLFVSRDRMRDINLEVLLLLEIECGILEILLLLKIECGILSYNLISYPD